MTMSFDASLPRPREQMVREIEKAQKDGDTIGGTFEVIARGVPPGLGSHTGWDTRLDGRLGAGHHVRQRRQGRGDRPGRADCIQPRLSGARRNCLR